ncbi:MAG TPA: hypothetical protein VNY04_02880 [Chthoniobacterales bacterium]|jgi:hypothetical protein|nr:hypothetical protein [Chthoniobacterales bacterium]
MSNPLIETIAQARIKRGWTAPKLVVEEVDLDDDSEEALQKAAKLSYAEARQRFVATLIGKQAK